MFLSRIFSIIPAAIVVLTIPVIAQGEGFTYQDCILRGLDGVKTDESVALLRDSCREQSSGDQSSRLVLPSVMMGTGRSVTCYFDRSSDAYKDVIFEVSYNQKSNVVQLVFKNPERIRESKFISRTRNRLSLSVMNNSGESILFDVFFRSGFFSMKLNDIEYTGVCEERR